MAEGIPQVVKCLIVVMGVAVASYSGITVFLVAQVRECTHIETTKVNFYY